MLNDSHTMSLPVYKALLSLFLSLSLVSKSFLSDNSSSISLPPSNEKKNRSLIIVILGGIWKSLSLVFNKRNEHYLLWYS